MTPVSTAMSRALTFTCRPKVTKLPLTIPSAARTAPSSLTVAAAMSPVRARLCSSTSFLSRDRSTACTRPMRTSWVVRSSEMRQPSREAPPATGSKGRTATRWMPAWRASRESSLARPLNPPPQAGV